MEIAKALFTEIMFSFFSRSASKPKPTLSTAVIPDGTRAYVVGDIHGRLDLLRTLHAKIRQDSETARGDRIVVYIGDYVDRGDDSKGVIDELLADPLAGFEPIYLKGNHEEALLNFLEHPEVARDWFSFGGDAAVMSYGVPVIPGALTDERLLDMQAAFRDALPDAHLRFLSDLRLFYEIGDYLCVHAGISPGRPLDRQRPEDLLWIREEFLESEKLHGKVVVHGHSVTETPDVQENRIGIDTGAYFSNCLTCLVLEGATHRFLRTASD